MTVLLMIFNAVMAPQMNNIPFDRFYGDQPSIYAVNESNFLLRVLVQNVRQTRGTIRVCLVNEKGDFLNTCRASKESPANAAELEVVFQDVKPGKYAISVSHDRNDNGELDLNALRIPVEPYGFSNNPSTFFGPPSFEKCLFEVNDNTTIQIQLK